jgi:protein-glutamine gamma-glutamyltransferase
MKKRATTPFATLCSLALCLWAYQTGAWKFAVPMIMLLEARQFILLRLSISYINFQVAHVIGGFLWLISIFYLPANSPTAISFSTIYIILKGLPIGLFPLILAQTYCPNFTSFYSTLFPQRISPKANINLYYPYFGICLLAAAATGGYIVGFLAVITILVAGFLATWRSRRFSVGTFYALMGLALIVSLMGTHQYYWLQSNFKPNGADFFSQLVEKVASLAPKESEKKAKEPISQQSTQTAQAPEKVAEMLPQNNPQPATTPAAQSSTSSQNTPPPPSSQSSQTPSASASASSETSNSEQSVATSTSVNEPSSSPETSKSSQSNESVNSSASSSSSAQEMVSVNTPSAPSSESSPPAQSAAPQGNGVGNANPAQVLVSALPNSNGITDSPTQPGLADGAGGAINPQTSVSQIGNQGTLQPSNAVLFRVAPLQSGRSPSFPLYIRLAAYNQYNLGRWDAVGSRFDRSAADGLHRWVFAPQSSGASKIRISETLQQGVGALKLPIGTTEVSQLAIDSMEVNQYGTVLFQGKPGELSYTVEYDPRRSPDTLPTREDLKVPAIEQPVLQKIVQSLNLQGQSAQEKLQAVEAFFAKGFQYSLNLQPPRNGETPLAAFLQDYRSGHCEYFASATSLLLREAGIPTRYTVGYVADEYNPANKDYVVRASNGHAWVMAYVNNSWVTVETTPGGGLFASPNNNDSSATGTSSQNTPQGSSSQISSSQNASTAQPNQANGSNFFSEKFSAAWSSLRDYFSKASGTGTSTVEKPSSQNRLETKSEKGKKSAKESDKKQPEQKNKAKKGKSFSEQLSALWNTVRTFLVKHWDMVIWASAIAILGLAIIIGSVTVAWRVLRRKQIQPTGSGIRRSRLSDSSTDAPDSAFYRIEQRLKDWGLEREPSETARQWITRLEKKLPPAQMQELNKIIDLHYRLRFDPESITEDDRQELRSMIQKWLRHTTAGVLTK